MIRTIKRGLSALFLASLLVPGALLAEDSHDSDSAPDYATVFNTEKVRDLTIKIPKSTYQNMLADMTDILGEPGTGAAIDDYEINILSRDPKWAKVSFAYEGETWNNVAMRFKGNSSLASLWNQGNRKLPFKFNVDKYEGDSVPEQKFHGFKKLTFAPNFSDNSQIKEAFVSDLLRAEGIPVARWSFVRVYVDRGEGREYWGLYTMIEEVDDGAMLKREFGSKSGNLYKPESDWTSFKTEEFIKNNNEDDSDWKDVEEAVGALLDQGPGKAAWRAKLERVFHVQGFLKWLAVNTLILNWDAYGQMAHNYYLYADPANDGRLVWIPWDYNYSMIDRGNSSEPSSLFHQAAGKKWPLISRLLADPVYKANYNRYLNEVLKGHLAKEESEKRLQKLHDLVAPSIASESTGSTTIESLNAFEDSLTGEDGLFKFLDARRALAHEALGL